LSQVLSFHDWFRYGKFAGRPWAQAHRSVVPEPFRNIEAGPVHMINVLSPAGAVVDPAVPEYVVHLVLSTPPLLQVGFNRRLQWLVMSPGVILVTPPDTDCDFVADGTSHVLAIGIPRVHVEDYMQDSGARVEVPREETFRDPRLARQLVRLWHTLSDGEPAGRLLADQVMRGALDTLARRTDAHVRARDARERLPGHIIRRLRDYVESSLADDLDVMMMASVAALSPAHFARAFAATVGMTPFEYVMTRRLARAHELLERTDRSALDIALTVGFKTPSHFASRFRREFGVTPREIRPDSRRPDERLDLNLNLNLNLNLDRNLDPNLDPNLILDSQKPDGVVVEDVTLV
jgi:AraC family transcriptional regulator